MYPRKRIALPVHIINDTKFLKRKKRELSGFT